MTYSHYTISQVNFQLLNNNGKSRDGGDSSGENSLRKKRKAPGVPPSARNQHLLRKNNKGQAPAPPNPFGITSQEFDPDKRVISDIYEVVGIENILNCSFFIWRRTCIFRYS